jgi:hypothetical protein
MTEISFHLGAIESIFFVSRRHQIANNVYKARFILVHREKDSFDGFIGKTFSFVRTPILSKREVYKEFYMGIQSTPASDLFTVLRTTIESASTL